MGEFIHTYFLASGIGWAMLGAGAGLMLGCAGSARGIRIAAGQAAGVMSEKPELFGKLLVLMALPGTQGFYGVIWTVMIALRVGLFGGEVSVSPLVGLATLFMGIAVGGALLKSAVFQGETSAACINLTARRPEQSGRAILMPALVETYALLAMVFGVVVLIFMTPPGGLKFASDKSAEKPPAVSTDK